MDRTWCPACNVTGSMDASSTRPTRDVRWALALCGIGALFVIAFVVLHVAAQALLLAFLGVLLGTTMRGGAEWVAAKLHWRITTSLIVCIAILIAGSVLTVLVVAPGIAERMTTLSDQLTAAYARVRAQLAASELGSRLPDSFGVEQPMQYAGRAAGVLASALGAIGASVFVGFIALYMSASPAVYRRGILRIVPVARRPRVAEVLEALATTLRRWMVGRLASMTAVGFATTIGLWIIGIPLAVTLGLLSGFLGFVPNIGPIVSAIPALLIAATIDLAHVGYVLALYIVINLADGYGLTPLLEKRAVSTPAALALLSQLVFGALWGIVGIMVATPLLACLLVIIRMLYVEDVLERAPSRPEAAQAS